MALACILIFLTLVVSFISFLPSTQAQNTTSFTATDKFNIPESKGSISFVVNGSCSEAVLANGTWIFKNLRLNNSFPLGDLKFSAQNCNVTIYSFFSGNYFARRFGFLSYNVEGEGTQEVNLGSNSSDPSDPSEWTVILPGSIFLAEGSGWKLLPDDTVVISGKTGNITIARYNYGLEVDNRPFYEQHSIAILTAIAVAAAASIGAIIKIKNRTGAIAK
jgi:archaellum component FlaF (FlaF/FlaG flagellin family)